MKIQLNSCAPHRLLYSATHTVHTLSNQVFPAPVKILLWQNVLLSALRFSPPVSVGDSGPCRLKGHWCRQSIRLRIQFQIISALIAGVWNPSGPTHGGMYCSAVSLFRLNKQESTTETLSSRWIEKRRLLAWCRSKCCLGKDINWTIGWGVTYWGSYRWYFSLPLVSFHPELYFTVKYYKAD